LFHAYTNPATTGVLTFDTVADAFGTAMVTVTVDDGQTTNRYFSRAFAVNLTAINDPPTLDPIANANILEDAPEQVITLTGITVGAANETNQSLTITAT